jgi:hypothetical protein
MFIVRNIYICRTEEQGSSSQEELVIQAPYVFNGRIEAYISYFLGFHFEVFYDTQYDPTVRTIVLSVFLYR